MINPTEADEITKGLLDSPRESRGIEFKQSFPWPSSNNEIASNPKAQDVIETILAMSNLRDGGKIIIGVEKSTTGNNLTCSGMQPDHLQNYDQDAIFDVVRHCGEPEPCFQILNVSWNGKNFIVFAVQSFMSAPVISANSKHLKPVYRSVFLIRTDKPETKKVTSPSEMREIIDLAIERELDLFSSRMQRIFRTMSHVKVVKSAIEDQKKFASEMSDVNE